MIVEPKQEQNVPIGNIERWKTQTIQSPRI